MDKKCLITGPEFRYWPTDHNLFLLGGFCINDTNIDNIPSNRITVLNEIGKDLSTREKNKKYTNDLFEKNLISLSLFLNKKHDVNYPVRYWRIILGPWLLALVPVVHNRWHMISEALDEKFDEIISIQFNKFEIVPYDYDDFLDIHLKSDWNSDLFSRILEFKDSSYKPIRLESFRMTSRSSIKNGYSIKAFFKRSVNKILELISYRRGKYFFFETYMPRISQIKLQLSMLQIPIFPKKIRASRTKPNIALRESMNLESDTNSEFETFLSQYLKLAIPTIHLEGYSELCNVLKKLPWPTQPKLVFTSIAYCTDEVFKAWIAKKVLNNTLYIIGQHGGGYGVEYFPHRTELHEKLSADYWLSWGWSDVTNNSVVPSLNLTLIGKKESNPNYQAKNILQVTNDLDPYSRYSWGLDEYNKIYMNDQFNFASSLREDIRDNLIIRLHFNQSYCDVDQTIAWSKSNKNIVIDQGFSNIKSLISKSRIVVSTYNATLFLETLQLNIPTIMFWNPEQNLINNKCRPYFDMLKAVKILHDTPESAAIHVSSIWDNVSNWWDNDELQRVRGVFCAEYSKSNIKPIFFMKRILESLVEKNSKYLDK